MSVDYYHLPRRADSSLPLPPAMPVPAAAVPALDHRRRFEAAVGVIQKLPKNGIYQPSYGVMLRFYGLYKQAVCGPCNQPRPGFWDPVGRYKWDAWSRLGAMSSEGAMSSYVEEMKKVAKEVLETLPVNEKTALLIQHFEPLYLVVDDMPPPPQELLDLRQVVNGSRPEKHPEDMKRSEDEDAGHDEQEEAEGLAAPPLETGPGAPESLGQPELSSNPLNDSGLSEGLAPTSDSESEIFCDSLDSEEQLLNIKVKTNGFQNGIHPDSSSHETVAGATQVGSGQGGEGGAGAGEEKGPRRRRSHSGRGCPDQSWRDRAAPPGGPRPPGRGAPNMGGGGGAGGGGGGGGGGGPEGGAERLLDAQLQQQIVVALRRLRGDMRSVMERLEAVEHLAAAHAQNDDWLLCSQCANSLNSPEGGEKWWPFDVSGHTLLLLLMWPLVAQGLLMLLRRAQRRGCVST